MNPDLRKEYFSVTFQSNGSEESTSDDHLILFTITEQLRQIQTAFATGETTTAHLTHFFPGTTFATENELFNRFAELLSTLHQQCFIELSKAKFDRTSSIGSRMLHTHLWLMTILQQAAIEAEACFANDRNVRKGLDSLAFFTTVCLGAFSLQEECRSELNDAVEDPLLSR